MRASVNQNRCAACGLCARTCPEVFQIDESSLARAVPKEVPAELESVCHDVADLCPVDAIRLVGHPVLVA
jgi:ferredoxin